MSPGSADHRLSPSSFGLTAGAAPAAGRGSGSRPNRKPLRIAHRARIAESGETACAAIGAPNPNPGVNVMASNTPPSEGDKAPAFTLAADSGGKVSLSDFKGKTLVLYFYPRDDTTGCTKEALAFSEKLPQFRKAGAEVIGVSKDSAARHDKFKEKHGLKLTLASDEDGGIVEQYGSWIEKSMYGRKYMGIDRSTFLIDGKGVIRRVWRKVRVPGHVDEVLEAVKSL
jgi:thioredoxin-dependent peroxiredoxin